MKATAQLTFERLRFDRPADAHLVVRLAAPPAPEASGRPPVCVIPVLDVSGSMEGAKLHHAKQSILRLVDHLSPGDSCGVVVFSGEVHTLVAPAAMAPAEKASLKAAVGHVQAQGNTNMGGGLLAGLDHARVTRLPAGMPVRVILFTDGLANAGPAKTGGELKALLAANQGCATVSTFGYGDDADQELLQELSNLGKGNYAYLNDPEEALTAFAQELGGLLTTHAQRIELRVTALPGADLVNVVSDVDAEGDERSVRIQIPELLADEVRDLILGVHLAQHPVALDAPVALAEVEVTLERLESGRLIQETTSCRATARFVEPTAAQTAPDPDLDRAVAIAQLVRAQLEAEEAARRGHFAEAAGVMTLFQSALVTRGHHEVAAAAGRLAATVQDESAFEASKAYRSSLRKGTSRSVGSKYDSGAEADLRAMGRGQSTEAQRRMEQSFRASTETPRGPVRKLDRRRSSRW
jgi:Ca-activated chloride channel homolog